MSVWATKLTNHSCLSASLSRDGILTLVVVKGNRGEA